MTKNYQEVTTPSDGRGSLAFANDNDCRRYTTLLQKDHVSVKGKGITKIPHFFPSGILTFPYFSENPTFFRKFHIFFENSTFFRKSHIFPKTHIFPKIPTVFENPTFFQKSPFSPKNPTSYCIKLGTFDFVHALHVC